MQILHNKYKKYLMTLVLLIVIFLSLGGVLSAQKPTIAVTVVPQIEMLRGVAGDKVEIVEMIPAGYSPANYSPSPSEMIAFNEAEIYFSMGVPADRQNILPRAEEIDGLKVIRLFEIVDQKYPPRFFDHGRDPHIWLSPKRAAYMVEIMRDEMISLMPEFEKEFKENAESYLNRLQEVDNKNRELLEPYQGDEILVYHPSFGYFTEHYGLEMLAIEEHGKDPGPKHIQEIIEKARENNIKHVFYQAEIDSKKTRAIAEELNGDTIKLNPLAENYLENLSDLAAAFAGVLEERVEQ